VLLTLVGLLSKFYELPALKDYQWYWRLEPDVEFTCSITYDPFVEMARRGKLYGYTIALWEVGDSCPGLFRAASDWMALRGIKPNALWRSMMSVSWAPWPLRSLLSLRPHRDASGDLWSMCHFWSNFEIANMDLFRSAKYQEFVDYLDRTGGFYYERVSDELRVCSGLPHFSLSQS
jgi:mannosyltransferase